VRPTYIKFETDDTAAGGAFEGREAKPATCTGLPDVPNSAYQQDEADRLLDTGYMVVVVERVQKEEGDGDGRRALEEEVEGEVKKVTFKIKDAFIGICTFVNGPSNDGVADAGLGRFKAGTFASTQSTTGLAPQLSTTIPNPSPTPRSPA
jgi:hypothetical protein